MNNGKLVFIPGNFIVVHPGHLRLFKFAREIGDKIIVGVYSDNYLQGKGNVTDLVRLEGVKSNVLVDDAIIIDEPIELLVSRIKPDYVLRGREHEHTEFREREALEQYGGKLVFCSGEKEFSTYDLLKEGYFSQKNFITHPPAQYFSNHKINRANILNTLSDFSTLKVLVIGDLIVDRYIDCQPLGMSQEEPCLSISPTSSKSFVGGAGIVALHAASLGAATRLMSVSGDDPLRDFIMDEMEDKVDCTLLKDIGRQTTLKERYRAKNRALLKVSHLHHGDISDQLQSQLLSKVEEIISEIDLLVFSDFNYGALPEAMVSKIISHCKANGVFVAADSQSSSQIGNLGRFRYANLVTPTEHEARLALHDNQSGLAVLSEGVREMLAAQNIFLKLGGDGVLVGGSEDENWAADMIPALNASPLDVAGAGDSMLISGSMALALGANIWEAALIGAYAAAIQVSQLGNVPIGRQKLEEAIRG